MIARRAVLALALCATFAAPSAFAQTYPSKPIRLILPDYRKPRRSLPISRFPVSLQEELARYLDEGCTTFILDEPANEEEMQQIGFTFELVTEHYAAA